MLKKFNIWFAVIALWVSLTWTVAAAPPQQEPLPPEPSNSGPATTGLPKLSTPQLIEAALAGGQIDQETANLYLAFALGDFQNLPAEYHSDVPWDGTLPLLHLQEAVNAMNDSPNRSRIIVILAGTCGSSTGSLPTIFNSTHFHIEYSTISGGLTINSYATSLEAAWAKEITEYGWAAPPVLAGNPPPVNRYHVRIDNLGGSLYGFVTTSGAHAGLVGNNPNTAWNDVDAYATCMVLNRDFSPFPGTSQQALDATTAHEFNHSIQFGYGAITGANAADSAFVEGGATWMEDEVFDSSNDNYNYLWPNFNLCMGQYSASPYPYWITWRGLTERFGTGSAGAGEQVMQTFWEETSKSATSNLFTALNTGLANKGTNLASAYHAFAIAAKFNKTCGGGYSYPYCFEEGANYVAAAGATPLNGTITTVGNNYGGSIVDNYALNWVRLPTSGGSYPVTLQNNSGGGQLRGSVVCDTGSTLNVTSLPAVVGPGASTSLASFNPAGCTSVIAVVTNQSQTAANPSTCTARSYLLRTDGVIAPNYLVFLPLVLKGADPCTPTGDSSNIGNALTICSGHTVSGQVSDPADLDDVFKLFISANHILTISMNGSGGDADLYLYPPGTTDVYSDPFVDFSENIGNSEFIQGTVLASGNWYIDVYAFTGTTNYNLTATVSNTSGAIIKTFTLSGTPRVRGDQKTK